MQLRRLRVKNIRSYESASLEFGSGTTLIAGDVGAGKTSLLYAIEMALFGVAEVDAAYLVRHGAVHAEVSVAFEGPDHVYEISRRFRRLRRKGKETFEAERIRFTVNGAETAYSATELRQQVIALLGFPDNPSPQAHSDLWRWAVYVPQERMRDILGARPQDRLETVRKALGVERYRTAAENALELATDLRRSAGSRRAEADRMRHFDDEYAEGGRIADRIRVDRVTLAHALREREAEVSSLRAARSELELRARKAEADERELLSLEREQEIDRRAIEEQRRLLEARGSEIALRGSDHAAAAVLAKQLGARREALESSDREVNRMRGDMEHRSADLRSLAEARAVLASAEQRSADARTAVARTRAEELDARKVDEEALAERPSREPRAPTPDDLAKIDDRLGAARREEATKLQSLAQAESSLAEVEELLHKGICPRCRQPVRASEYESHRAEAVASLEAARTGLRAAAEVRSRLEAERGSRERYERALDRWKEVERRRAVSRTSLERASNASALAHTDLTSAERSAETARRRTELLLPEESRQPTLPTELARAEASRAARAQDVEESVLATERGLGIALAIEALTAENRRLEGELGAKGVRMNDRSARLDDLRAGREALAAVRTAVTESEHQLRAVEETLAAERSTLARLDAQLDEAVRRTSAAESGRRERAELVAEAVEVEEKAAWVGTKFRLALLTMEQKLLTHAQALFERDFARYFASLIDDPGLVARTDPAFTPLVMIEGEWTPAEALSGGERTSLALAFRLALARVVRTMGSLQLNTLLLDEPTDGFSPEQVIRMGELLEEIALPQVVIVSHESQLAAIADRVIRVQKVEGRSFLEGENSSEAGDPTDRPPNASVG